MVPPDVDAKEVFYDLPGVNVNYKPEFKLTAAAVLYEEQNTQNFFGGEF